MSKKSEITLSIIILLIALPLLEAYVTRGAIAALFAQLLATILNGLMIFIAIIVNTAIAVCAPVFYKLVMPIALWAIGLFILYKVGMAMYDGMKKAAPKPAAKKKGGGGDHH